MVQGGLCGAVVGAAGDGHEGEAAGDEDHGGGGGGRPQGDEVREEGGYSQQRGGVVGVDLAGDLGGELVVRGVGEVQGALDARVEDYGGQGWVLLGDAGEELVVIDDEAPSSLVMFFREGGRRSLPLSPSLDLGCLGHVELLGHDLVAAVLGLELLEALLAPADGDDEDAVLDHPLG